MALQSLSSVVQYPIGFYGTDVPVYGQATVCDASGEYYGYIMQAQEDMVVSHVGFRVGNVSGSGALDVRIETVDTTSGLATGTLWATNTNVTTGALTDNAWSLHALGASATINRGQVFCLKFVYSSGTSVQILGLTRIKGGTMGGFPYQTFNFGSDQKGLLTQGGCVALGSSSTSFYNVNIFWPFSSSTTTSIANNATNRALCARFNLPFTCQIIGIRYSDHTYNAASDFDAVLYSDAGTELSSSSTAFDGHITAVSNGPRDLFFDNPVTVSAGTWYRAALVSSTTNATVVTTFTMPSTDYAGAAPSGGNYYLGVRDSGGTWTDTTTSVPMIDLLIDKLDDGVSTGGGGAAGIVGLHGINNGVLA